MRSTGNCWNCGQNFNETDYGREATCDQCGKSTHACRNCEFYDPASNNECREPVADRVVEKEGGNFCDYFNPVTHLSKAQTQTRESLKSAAEALFKKK